MSLFRENAKLKGSAARVWQGLSYPTSEMAGSVRVEVKVHNEVISVITLVVLLLLGKEESTEDA